ncbi:transporter [Streptomyces sp. NBC_00006]|uniref:transporter n=1 Tax=Streptomyces sp. NBC_00006 TaxID=2975619 RepID=UPI002256E89C|nr:transporter [Streptomyces sp. NBC_00006]MCX5529921.1 transporter [Streptomyces sp. NBC_00006]
MIWLTWRQLRTQATAVIAALAALAALLAATGPHLAGLHTTAGRGLVQQLSPTDTTLYFVGGVTVLLVPALIGMFWGAPLVSRELETGTHRLAWNQGVTRTRWLVTKLTLTGLTATAATALISLAVTWWSSPVDQAVAAGGSDNTDNFVPRIDPAIFSARGVVPLGYAAFAFALGVLFGIVIRRTLPAMAATLATYTAALLSMPMWIREHLAPATTVTVPFTHDRMANYLLDSVSHIDTGKPDVWVTAEQTLNATGHPAHAMPPAYTHCESIKSCIDALAKAGYHQRVTYQAADNFWPLQWAETGVFLSLAVGLGVLGVWWTRKRLLKVSVQ